MKISERLTRFVQGTAVAIALAMLMVGGFVYASPTSEKLLQPSLYQDIVVSNPECAVYLEPSDYHSDGMYFSVANGVGEFVAGFIDFWNCITLDTATCGWLVGAACWSAGFLVEIGVWASGGALVLRGLVKSIKKPLLKGADWAIKKLKNVAAGLPTVMIKASTLNNIIFKLPISKSKKLELALTKDLVISFAALASMIGTAAFSIKKLIDFLTDWTMSQVRKICRGVFCNT